MARTSKIPGDAVLPVSAARKGCAILPSFRSSASANDLTAGSVASALYNAMARAESNPQLAEVYRTLFKAVDAVLSAIVSDWCVSAGHRFL